jgi:Large-conductance mechanosensitive channel, MscL
MRCLADSGRFYCVATSSIWRSLWLSGGFRKRCNCPGERYHHAYRRRDWWPANFSQLTFTINNSEFFYGAFINAVLAFVIIAAAVYFVVVVPTTSFMARFKPSAPPAPTRDCPFCTSAIAIAATRCPSEISPAGQ